MVPLVSPGQWIQRAGEVKGGSTSQEQKQKRYYCYNNICQFPACISMVPAITLQYPQQSKESSCDPQLSIVCRSGKQTQSARGLVCLEYSSDNNGQELGELCSTTEAGYDSVLSGRNRMGDSCLSSDFLVITGAWYFTSFFHSKFLKCVCVCVCFTFMFQFRLDTFHVSFGKVWCWTTRLIPTPRTPQWNLLTPSISCLPFPVSLPYTPLALSGVIS